MTGMVDEATKHIRTKHDVDDLLEELSSRSKDKGRAG